MSDLTVQLRHAKRSNETKLDLSCKSISYVPNEVYALTALEILNLSRNKISSIEGKIEQLVNLKFLDLSDNSLMEVPSELLKLGKLQVLNLAGNPLIKKFEPLLEKDAAVTPRLERTLKRCFGLEAGEEESKPSWLEGESQPNSNKMLGRVIEVETLYKNEQARVKQLEKELEKLALVSHSSIKKTGLRLDPHPIL